MLFKPKPLPDYTFNATVRPPAFSGNTMGFASVKTTLPKPVLRFTPLNDTFGAPRRFQATAK